MSNNKTLPLEDIFGVSKSWLEVYKTTLEATNASKSELSIIDTIYSQIFPLTPIVDDAFGIGYDCCESGIKKKFAKEKYLSQPITIKKK